MGNGFGVSLRGSMASMGGERRWGYLFVNSAQLHRPELVYESACAVTMESLQDVGRIGHKWLAGYSFGRRTVFIFIATGTHNTRLDSGRRRIPLCVVEKEAQAVNSTLGDFSNPTGLTNSYPSHRITCSPVRPISRLQRSAFCCGMQGGPRASCHITIQDRRACSR